MISRLMVDGGSAYFPYILKEKNDRYKNIFISFDGSSEVAKNSPALGSLAPKDIRIGDFDGDGSDDILAKSNSSLYVSWSGKSRWTNFGSFSLDIKYLGLGDFNGNGTTDIFYRDDQNRWMVRFHNKNLTEAPSLWTNIGESGNDVPNIRFGDFDGNGVTDIFRIKDGEWLVSFGSLGQGSMAFGLLCSRRGMTASTLPALSQFF